MLSDGGLLRIIRAVQLPGQRSGAEIAGGAEFEGNAALGEQVHEGIIVHGGDAVADADDVEKFDGFANFIWAADFAGMDERRKSGSAREIVDGNEVARRETEFIAADAEGDYVIARGLRGESGDFHCSGGAEVADSVENPIDAQAVGITDRSIFEGSDGVAHGGEIREWILLAEKHYADGKGDFGEDDVLGEQVVREAASDQRVIGRSAQKGSDPFEGFEKTQKIWGFVARGDFGFRESFSVTRGKFHGGFRRDGAFEVEMEFGFREGGDKRIERVGQVKILCVGLRAG
jgi:hypothetical protein